MTDPETTGPTADPSTDAAARVPTRPLGTGRSRLRWLVAGIVTLAVIVAAMGVAAFAGQRTSSGAAAPAYLPADTLVYADARLDLPGDQGQQLAAFLAKFPGFADQSALPAKLDDLMSRLVNETTHDQVDWGTDVKPWFGGQVAAGLIAVPASTNATTPPPSLIALTVTDEAAAGKAVDAALSRSGLAVTATQSHRDVTIRTVKVPVPDTATTQGAPQSESLSFAVAPGMLLLSPQASTISQALDLEAGQGSSLADASAFTSAVGKLRADRLGTFYLDAPGLLAAVSKAAASASPAASAMAGLRDAVGGPIAAELHVEDGRLVAVSRTPRGSAMPAQTARTSDLAAHVPADSVLYVETHDAGKLIATGLSKLESSPALQGDSAQLQAIQGLLGGDLDDLFSWLGDAGASVSIGSDGAPSGGIVALAADASAGKVRVQQWLGLLKLAGAQAGGAISVTEAPYAGTTITTIHVDAGSVAGTALGGAPSAAPASGAEVEVAVAFKDGLLVIGASDAFVKRVLDLSPADSLAQLASYREALGAAGGPSDTGVAWLAASQLRTALEPLIPASERAQYDSQVEPFLAPIDHLVAVNTNDGDTIVSHMELATR